MKISIIVAIAENNVIGKNNQMPWHLPNDLKHFKNTTTGHHIIMGRKNYESILRPLPNRTNIIISRQNNYIAEGCIVVSSLLQALQIAKENGETETFIIGGGEIYKQALPYIDTIYLTEIQATIEGDVCFPDVDLSNWNLLNKEEYPADEKNKYAFSICKYEKLKSNNE